MHNNMHNLKQEEEKILKFWKEKKIYEKSKKKNKNGKKFYFMDGPPYATGNIHLGTALNKILKDVAMRAQRLQEKNVFDRAGYDTHGLPIENKVEKELGFKRKSDIEKYGVKKFIEKCKKFATEHIELMNNEFKNLGVWMDFDNPYLTLDKQYIESIWDTFKEADKKGLLYLGKYPVHVCPHCETAVAYNEIEYTKKTDPSIYVKFKLKNSNKYLIIWTTTPWTLPNNTGVMVNPRFDYAEIKVGNEIWIIAKERIENLMKKIKKDYKINKIFPGKDLKGLIYENPLSKYLKLGKIKNGYKIILNERYVNLDEGTGLVHTAPGCGKEDFDAGKKEGLPIICIVDIKGIFNGKGGKYAGKKVKEVTKEVIKDLEKDNFLVYEEDYVHDYPICWRCKSPLILISIPQWFFRISKIQKNILKANEEVNWIPSYMKLRMKAWLEGISDWPISRNRYWGTPLPIWICNKCHKKEIISSVKELEKKSKKKITEIHKPEIDNITWKCKCGGVMKRVPEVLDVWFDSGVSSWAALYYPQKKEFFQKFWPADLNIEGKDQFRGWWNSQIILSEIKFGKKPFNNIMVHGLVLNIGKVKMSKSLGNVISPEEIIERYGRDAMRYYFSKTSKGEDFAFNERDFKEVNKFFRVLINLNNFLNQIEKGKNEIRIEDKWILSKFNSLIKEIKESYNKFLFFDVIQKLEKFLIEDLSKIYIKLIREREKEIYDLLKEIFLGVLKLSAPIIPFLTEKIWQELKERKIVNEESIHLSSWPKCNEKEIDKKLEEDFKVILKIIEKGLAERDKAKIGLRWPLSKITIYAPEKIKDYSRIILKQLNVKEIIVKKSDELYVEIDTTITPQLEAEGYAREISRQIQQFRKKLGLQKKDKVETFIIIKDDEFQKILEQQKTFIKQKTNSKKFEILNVTTHKEKFKNKTNFKIKNKKGEIAINKD